MNGRQHRKYMVRQMVKTADDRFNTDRNRDTDCHLIYLGELARMYGMDRAHVLAMAEDYAGRDHE